ncbi:MAG: glycosyltransferase [Acidobacteria bacterium]|nr:MAG: glycosyltransferase [Acidobacteriota bacterium]
MTPPLRVAVTNWSARRVGGIEDYVGAVIDALHQAGTPVAFWHEVDQPSDRSRIELPANVPRICAADAGLDAALEALREWRPNVIYAHGLFDLDAGRRLQQIAPSVLFLHTYTGTCISGRKTLTRPGVVPCDRTFGWPCLALYFPRGCGGRSPITMWTEFRRQSSLLEVMHGYRQILTHSEHMKSEMSKHGLRADVVPYAVAVKPVAHEHRNSRRWRLLYASRLDFLKGGGFLLDALSRVTARASRPISLTVAGDGPERVLLESRARLLRNDMAQIAFTGWLSHERIRQLLQETDVLVVPSVWPEPFGSIGPLAAQHGVPAAAFDVGGIRSWLTDGVSGHLAPGNPPTARGLAEAILRCVADSQQHAELRRGARESARRFTMANHLPALMASLERAACQ